MSADLIARLMAAANLECGDTADLLNEAAGVISDKTIVDSHPEMRCQKCRGPNFVWFAPNPIWNAVVEERTDILCPTCFAAMAESKGLDKDAWRLEPEFYRDPRWRSLDDPPAKSCRVLVGIPETPTSGATVQIVWYVPDAPVGYRARYKQGFRTKNGTKWMPLPEPPK